MALFLFDFLSPLYHFSKEERILLEYSALLHDIGLFINKEHHGKHTQYLILKDSLLNSVPTHPRAMLAQVAGAHRKSMAKGFKNFCPKDRELILNMVSILRVADGLDHTHKFDTSIAEICNERGTLILKIRGINLDLIHNKLIRKSTLFTDTFGYTLNFQEYDR